MRKTVDCIVCICLLVVVYINWTDFPKLANTVNSSLIKLGVPE